MTLYIYLLIMLLNIVLRRLTTDLYEKREGIR